MRYADYIDLFDQAVSNLRGRAFFGHGTLEEMNSGSNDQYPLVWLVTPLQVNNQYAGASADFFSEGYNVRLRVVSSASMADSEEKAKVIYNENKIISEAIIQQFRDTDDLEVQNFNLLQIFKEQDDVHIGWEATFTLISYIEPDECCSLAFPLVIPPDPDDCFERVENLCNVERVDANGTVLILNLETGIWEIKLPPWVTSDGLTAGSIPFADANGALTQSNVNWFYDAANNRVGLGTNTPSTRFDVTGHPIISQADGSVMSVNVTGVLLQNDINIRTYSMVKLVPTFNTGVLNANTTFDVLSIDTINSSVAGLTVNLFATRYGGVLRSRIRANSNNIMSLFNGAGTDMFNFNSSSLTGHAELQMADSGSVPRIFFSAANGANSFISQGMLALGQTTADERLHVNGNIKTAAPSANGAGAFSMGKVVNGAYVNLDTAKALEVMIDGVVYHLQLVTT